MNEIERIVALKEDISELRAALSAHHASNDILSVEVEELRAELAEADRACDDYNRDLAQAANDRDTAVARLETVQADLAKANRKLAIAKEYIDRLEYYDDGYYGVTGSDEAKAYYAAIKEKDNG